MSKVPKKIFGPRGSFLRYRVSRIEKSMGLTWCHKTSKIPYVDQIFLSELLTQFNILYK